MSSTHADVSINFCLKRNGTVYFSQPRFREVALQEASERFATNDGHNIRKWVADQCYFFLRDATHAHQHHEPSSDTILILQERGNGDDIQWRRNIVYSLHYAIIRFKRDTDSRSALRAKGILAYCDSFIACCKADTRGQALDMPEFNSASLLMSLDAKSQEISVAEQIAANRLNTELAKTIASRTIALAFVAILIAAIAILIQPRISSQENTEFPLLFKVSTFAAENFFNFLGLSFVIVVVTWLTTAFNLRVSHKRVGRSLLEASYVRREGAIAAFAISTAAIGAATFWLFWPAVASLIETLKDFVSLFR
jgi:hypothetical protein